jgi:hypothetical protein
MAIEFDERQAIQVAGILLAYGAGLPAQSWSESYDDFRLFLEDAGLTVDGLPSWQPATAVLVVAKLPKIWLRRLSPAEHKQRQKWLKRGKTRLEAVPLAELAGPTWERLQVVGIDPAKFRAAAIALPWERV